LAFGKVILLGEHAVVYGHSALAGALARGVTATAARGRGATTLAVPAWDAYVTTADDTPMAAALRDLVEGVAGSDAAFDLSATAQLPPGAGLGSSAALAVAVTRALAGAIGRELSADDVERIANRAERHFHDNPSGIDVALATRGGLGVFRRGTGLAQLRCSTIRLAIGLSGEPRSTGDMVRIVARAADSSEDSRRDLRMLGEAADTGVLAIERGELPALGGLFDEAHERLARLGVSTPTLDRLVATAREAGALGAKLTGAGGGGAVIALAPDREAAIVDAWRSAGFEAFISEVGVTA